MRIKNIDGLSASDLQKEAGKGGRFVYYSYTVSFIIVTFRRVSGVYLVRSNENAFRKGLRFTLLSVLFGWWGIPSGPKYTFESIRTNLRGGKDVTEDVMAVVEGYALFNEAENKRSA